MSTSLVWFKNDLRIQDQHSLYNAVAKGNRVIALYCFEKAFFKEDIFGFKKTEKYRAQFLLETIRELKTSLESLNIDLLLHYDDAINVIPKIIDFYSITDVFLQKEWTQEEVSVVTQVKEKAHHITWHETYDQFLFHPDDIPYQGFEKIPNVFTAFRKECEKKVAVRTVLPSIIKLPVSNRIQNNTEVPTLSVLGLDKFTIDTRTVFPYMGGEVQAKKRIHYYFWETRKLAFYKKTRNGLVGTDYSSKLSPWLANGSISSRQIYWEVQQFEKEIKKNQDTYWLIFELIWRDYFKYVSLKYGNAIFKMGGILHKDYEWSTNKAALQDWIEGKTPYDFVNANMIELRKTGWMSNRGRQNVASYWAKELKQDWRIGAAYFESMLIDYDVHSNWGNWMYNAGVGNDPRDRKFNINGQADRYDPQGKFRKLWLQETLF
ncbi:deoxyribodipyrimidine photo-lyase [Dokdonia pacifica]|uniref:Cryptochrome DASH n=1 Tax=Dokdonia pacifica TaxID=1627892 RepID=A0A238W9P8_9FLAO|nr:DASH family cryptochrome [Dokdonia pacifica]GGG13902.1 deoxyribodipyrimidine photo-lyase [Dokdonia pacifica]SNR43117.1 deoxyribodipyrimidine photo-lyase (single-stranded DNA-specific) [Dokdonia pacifica]